MRRRAAGVPATSHERPVLGLTYSLTLGSSPAAWKPLVTHREELNGPASRWGLEEPRVRAALCGERSTSRHHRFFVEPSPHPAGKAPVAPPLSYLLTLSNLQEWFPETPPHPGHTPGLNLFHWHFHISRLPQLTLWTWLKSLEGPQIPNKKWLASVCPVPLAKWSQPWHKWQSVSTCIVTPIRWPQTWHKLWPLGLECSFN